jgi:hypothetical protein
MLLTGERERGLLTTFAPLAANARTIPDDAPAMDAVTIAERQREGGGAPSARRRKRVAGERMGVWQSARESLLRLPGLSMWRLRARRVT